MKWSLGCRTFAKKPDDVETRAQQVAELFEIALPIQKSNGKPFFEKVFCSVWNGKNFSGEADCGQTAGVLRQRIKDPRVKIIDFTDGDLFVSSFNNMFFHGAFVAQAEAMLLVSPEASSYLNERVMNEFQEAFTAGALAVGLAITELQDSIMKGRLANTFAAWSLEAAITHGGFNKAAAMKSEKDLTANMKKGFDPKTGDMRFYPYHGVEEIRLLAELVANHGPCLAPIMPRDESGKVQEYELPTDSALLERHWNKMATKIARQDSHLTDAGYHTDVLENGVMFQYRPGAKDASEITSN